MARRKRRSRALDPEAVAAGRVRASIEELFRLIHEVNPTERGLDESEEERRYALKASLQSRLINEHGHLLVAEPMERDAGVVSLAHRSGSRDACHARIDALDADARLWLRRQGVERELGMDEAASTTGSGSRSATATDRPPRPHRRSPYEAGIQALEDYDYEAARAHFESVLEHGDRQTEAARALMDLLVDHLALDAEAISLVERLSPKLRDDDTIRTLGAKAFARQDRYDEAMTLLRGVHGENAALAWKRVGRAALRHGDFDATERAIQGIRDADAAHPAATTIADELTKARAEARAPAEAQLTLLAEQQQWDDAESEALRIQEQWPRSKVARSVLVQVQRARTAAEIATTLRAADASEQRGELARAIKLIQKAIGLGDEREATAARLERLRLSHAENLLINEAQAVVDAYLEGLDVGRRRWLDASERARDLAKADIEDPRLADLEQLAAAVPREEHVALPAALDALTALEAHRSQEAPQALLDTLAPHRTLCLRLTRVRDLKRWAQTSLQAAVRAENEAALRALEDALDADELEQGRTVYERLQSQALSSEQAERCSALHDRLRAVETQRAMLARYEALLAEGELIAARDVAREATGIDTPHSAEWATRAVQVEQRIKEVFGPFALPAEAGWADLRERKSAYSAMANAWLDTDGVRALVSDVSDEFVFLRLLRLDSGELEQVAVLRTPEAMDVHTVQVHRGRAWFTDDRWLLVLDLQSWEIITWRRLDAFIASTESIRGMALAPDGQHLWLLTEGGRRGRCVIVDTRTWRSVRSIPGAKDVRPCAGPNIDLMAVAGEDGVSYGYPTKGGRPKVRVPLRDPGDACSSPRGNGLVLLGSSDVEEAGKVEKPLVIMRWSEGNDRVNGTPMRGFLPDDMHQIESSSRSGLVYFLGAPARGNNRMLYAFEVNEFRLSQVWYVAVPRACFLVTDIEGQSVALASHTPQGFVITPLGNEAPDADLPQSWFIGSLPDFQDVLGELQQGGAGALLQKQLSDLENRHPELVLNDHAAVTAALDDDPGALGTVVLCHLRDGDSALAEALLDDPCCVPKKHWSLSLAHAVFAATRKSWGESLQVLGEATQVPAALGSWHIYEVMLRAYAHINLGEIERAREAWLTVPAHERLQEWMDYLEELLEIPDPRRAGRNVAAIETLRNLRTSDEHIAMGELEAALATLDKPFHWAQRDRQVMARLARVRLSLPDKSPSNLYRSLVTLQYFRDLREGSRMRSRNLRLGSATYDDDHLQELAERADLEAERIWVALGGGPYRAADDTDDDAEAVVEGEQEPAPDAEAAVVEPGEPMAARKPRPSKVDPFIDKVGVLPDKEVAVLAGVTPENVRAYRKRRGIPARWRGEGEADESHSQAAEAPTAAGATPKASKPRKGRKTKLDPYLDKLGVLPDQEVAELAGVTVGNVRAYRYRHGIPGPGRGRRAKATAPAPTPVVEAPVEAATPPSEVIAEQPAVPAREAAPTPPVAPEPALEPAVEKAPPAGQSSGNAHPEAPGGGQVKAFRVKVEGVGGTVAYVVLAQDIAEAASKAVRTLQQRKVDGEVLSVEYLAVALQH